MGAYQLTLPLLLLLLLMLLLMLLLVVCFVDQPGGVDQLHSWLLVYPMRLPSSCTLTAVCGHVIAFLEHPK